MRPIEKAAHVAPHPSERETASTACCCSPVAVLPESYPRVLKSSIRDLPLPQADIVSGKGRVFIPLRTQRLRELMQALYPYWNSYHFGSV